LDDAVSGTKYMVWPAMVPEQQLGAAAPTTASGRTLPACGAQR
jgi:hypothetical protein